MRRAARGWMIALAVLVAALLMCAFAERHGVIAGGSARAKDFVLIVFTAAPRYEPLVAIERGGERFPEGAELRILRNQRTDALLPEFFASADASVSFDATTVLFAGKKNRGDVWQVWELNLASHEVRRVIAASEDSIRPMYLPGGRLVYAQRRLEGFAIEAASLDGSDQLELTHLHGNALPVDVLEDGRILFESSFPLGTTGQPELYLVYSDGSGVESYRCDHGAVRWGGRQLRSGPNAGDVVFTHGRSLARFISPRAAETAIRVPAAEYAGPISEETTGDWVAATRVRSDGRYALMRVRSGAAALTTVVADDRNDLIEPVALAPRTTPKQHPSGLHEWATANLLALDVRVSRDGALEKTPARVRVEAQGEDGRAVEIGEAPIESDGSFFVKTPGDRPIRFALLDGSGAVVRAERGWFWARGGEQRICVGCHAGPERAPENRVPQVLLRTTTPADMTGASNPAVQGGR
jgi:hypothetical protein